MATVKGSTIVARAPKNEGVDIFFYLRGGPIGGIINDCHAVGLQGINTRHEQAAAFAADAYGRTSRTPGVCLLFSGPGYTYASNGLALAYHHRQGHVAGVPGLGQQLIGLRQPGLSVWLVLGPLRQLLLR